MASSAVKCVTKKTAVSSRLGHGVHRFIVKHKKHHFSSDALGSVVDVAEQFVVRTTETAANILQQGRNTISSAAIAAAIKITVASREFESKLNQAGHAGVESVMAHKKKLVKMTKSEFAKLSTAQKVARKFDYGYNLAPARVRHIMNEARPKDSRLTFEAVVWMAFATTKLVDYISDVATSYNATRHAGKKGEKTYRVMVDDLAYIASNDALIGGVIVSGSIPSYSSKNKLQRGVRSKRAKPDTVCPMPPKKKARKAAAAAPPCPKGKKAVKKSKTAAKPKVKKDKKKAKAAAKPKSPIESLGCL